MNLCVVGSQGLSDWILRMIEDTKGQLLELTPPIELKVTAHAENCDAMIGEANAEEHLRVREAYPDLPCLCIVEPDGEISQTAGEIHFFRAAQESDPDHLKARFCEAIRTIFLQCHLHAFQRTLSGPFSHDVRGALSVVSLSRQLLESGGDGHMVAGRLGRVDSRIAMALFDVEARSLCLSGAWPPLAGNTPMGAPRVEEIIDWFARTQGDRKLEATADVLEEMRQAPQWVNVALAGCIDGVTRLTQGTVELTTASKQDCSFFVCVRGESTELDQAQLSCLTEPERWPLLSAHVVPYRLGTAALLMGAAGGSALGRVESGNLIVEMRLP